MHELGIALEVVDIVTRGAAGRSVKRVVVEVGELTAVLPEALTFSFQLACEGTVAAGANLEVVKLEGDVLRVREMELA